MDFKDLHPLAEVVRGNIVESVHLGAVAVVDVQGKLLLSYGNPDAVTFLRSSSKPFQALPFVEAGGVEHYGLSGRELAAMCASHTGTDEQVAVVRSLQQKTGVSEDQLQCGSHQPYDKPTANALLLRGEKPTPIRHNCSGKHSGMLAYARLRGESLENYLDFDHPLQKMILKTFAEMCGMAPAEVEMGIDGCSAPNFAVPLRCAALAFARLADPHALEDRRAHALRRIFKAMTENPDMVGGVETFDTLLMQACRGKVLSKGGAEGYQAIAVLPQEGKHGGMGICYKVADGDGARLGEKDVNGRIRPLIGVVLLRDLGLLSKEQLAALERFDRRPIVNWRKLPVGEIRACYRSQGGGA
jgi:L-asparaginase II